jgi:ABC-2 type transport system ATP-binding protein
MHDNQRSLAIEICSLYKKYGDGKVALKSINLQVEQGAFYGLLGPNGAGKSTTIGILSSLVEKTSGTVNILGFNFDQQPLKAKKLLGIVPQEFNFNIFETCSQVLLQCAGYYGIDLQLAKKRCEFLLKEMGLWRHQHDAIRTLSGGMKRRLMIARALIHEPKILILDEPTAGVDVTLRRFLWDFLKKLNQSGLTILLTTHYLEEAEALCNQLAIIDQGQVIKFGTTNELLSQLTYETLLVECRGLSSSQSLTGLDYVYFEEDKIKVKLPAHMSINHLVKILDRQGVEVMKIKNTTSRLEELFMQLVHANREVSVDV